MNRWVKVLTVCLIFVLCFALAGKVTSASTEAPSIKALIVTGQSNPWHRWERSSPILKQILEQTGLFKVDMAISPPGNKGIENFKPDFAAYDVVVLDYDGYDRKGWSEVTKTAFVEYVETGGGVVIYHGADNSFPKWKEYNEIIGLGGWGGRNEKDGPMVRWRDGEVVFDNTPGDAGSHGPAHEFQIVNRNREHPVTRDLPEEWMHTKDELYGELRGPAKNLTVLSTAYSDPAKEGTGEHEPILFTIDYGKGRVFHTVLGHARELPLPSMECVGFIVTFQRGAEWAATGEVTQNVPVDFPTATEVRKWKNYRPPSLDELLEEIATYEFGQSRENLTRLGDIVRDSYQSEKQRKDIEKRFLKFLRSDATLASKQFICKQLSIIGTEEAVPALAAMLTKPATSDMSRYALERIPGATVDKALVKALGRTRGKAKVGIINSLGERATTEATLSLSRLLDDRDKQVARAAAASLGKIGGPQAAEAIGKALGRSSNDLRMVLADAYLMCADKFMTSGDKDAAMAIYEELYVPSEPVPIRSAALAGITAAAPDKGIELIVDVLRGEDEAMQTVAIELVRLIPGQEATQAVAKELRNLSATRKVQLLAVMGDRRDPSVLRDVVKATSAKDETVRIAALKALGAYGRDEAVVVLAERAAATTGQERGVARESLYRLGGAMVDSTILGGILDATNPKVKIELIRSVGQRNIVSAVDTLLETAQEPDPDMRMESIKALSDVASPEHISALVELLINAKNEAELKAAEKAVVSVSRKSVDKNVGTAVVLGAIDSVKDVKIRCSLLSVLGGIGDSEALDVLREALEDKNSKVQMAAVRALSDWPNAEPAADLLKVVSSSEGEKRRDLAFRGYVRLIGLDSDRSANETVELYTQAMGVASSVSEKKMVLSGLAKVESFAALYTASEYLKDNELQEEAGAAMVKIAESTRESHPQQTKMLLQMVLQKSKSDSLREQAEELLEEID
jgi:HEAT repeat protein/type 1 glutamine amidotransferase